MLQIVSESEKNGSVGLQCESKNPPCGFTNFFSNGWEFLIIFYTPITRT